MSVRATLWILLAGCWQVSPPAASPPPAPEAALSPAAAPCDASRWRELAATTRRAWLVSLDRPHAHREAAPARGAWRPREPVAVLDFEGGDVRVATLREDVIVTRWVAVTGLGRAAIAGAAVSPSPGGAPDPAVRIRIGYRLPDGDRPWLSVAHAPTELDGLELHGVVPSAIRGILWDEPPRAPGLALAMHHDGVILDAPHAGAPARAKVTREAEIQIRGTHPGFWEVTARTPRAEVDGFIPQPPPPPPSPAGRNRYDFSDDTIEGELIRPGTPLPAGTCLHDTPGGDVAGMLLAPQPAMLRPLPRAPGWSSLQVATTWGTVTYFAIAPR